MLCDAGMNEASTRDNSQLKSSELRAREKEHEKEAKLLADNDAKFAAYGKYKRYDALSWMDGWR